MIEIILDEKDWCENLLRGFTMGSNPVGALSRLAKYYHSLGYKKPDTERLLEEFILRCNPSANIMQWQQYIDSCVAQADKRPLILIDGITVTKAEMNAIRQLSGLSCQKVMFTMLCLAKYRNAVNPKNNYWVNYETKSIFRLANVEMVKSRQYAVLNDLLVKEYIGVSKIVDNTSMQVLIGQEDDEVVLRITDFRNLGLRYMHYHSGGYIECQNCGLLTKWRSNRQKYCNDCYRTIHARRKQCTA